jgi:hypothetical protein
MIYLKMECHFLTIKTFVNNFQISIYHKKTLQNDWSNLEYIFITHENFILLKLISLYTVIKYDFFFIA